MALTVVLTFIDPVADIASPSPLVDELHKRVDVGSTLSTTHDCGTLDHRKMTQVLERVDQHTQRQAGLFQNRLSLRDLKTKRSAISQNPSSCIVKENDWFGNRGRCRYC